VFLLVAGGVVQLCISGDVYAEYEEVIRRPRLARDEEVIAATLQTVREKGFGCGPRRRSRRAPTRTTIFFSNARLPHLRITW
jgi:hypothetical protein